MQLNLLNQPAKLYGITNQMKPLSHGAVDLVCSCYFLVRGCNLKVWPSLAVLYIALFVTQCWEVSRILTTGCLDCGVYAPTIRSSSDLGLWERMSKYSVAP